MLSNEPASNNQELHENVKPFSSPAFPSTLRAMFAQTLGRATYSAHPSPSCTSVRGVTSKLAAAVPGNPTKCHVGFRHRRSSSSKASFPPGSNSSRNSDQPTSNPSQTSATDGGEKEEREREKRNSSAGQGGRRKSSRHQAQPVDAVTEPVTKLSTSAEAFNINVPAVPSTEHLRYGGKYNILEIFRCLGVHCCPSSHTSLYL